MRESESLRGGNSRVFLWQPRRSYATAVRFNGGDRGPARVADIKGDRGNWTAVRPRKRKATELEQSGRDWSKGDDGYGKASTGQGQARQQVFNQVSKADHRERQTDGGRGNRRLFNNGGRRIASVEWHGNGAAVSASGRKASFYVTNFPDNSPLFRLRKAFEVCGILTDVYIARHRNARGQEFGFVRFVNVKNVEKLSHALINVWLGDCRILAKEARFDRFAHNDNTVTSVGRKEGAVGRLRVHVTKNSEGVKGEMVQKVEAPVGGSDRTAKARRVEVTEGQLYGTDVEDLRRPVMLEGDVTVTDRKVQRKNGITPHLVDGKQPQQGQFETKFIPSYAASEEDTNWANAGMVVNIISGDSALDIQQRVVDAGFSGVVVTPLGGDKVFLHCQDGEHIWHVFNDALHFLGMLFSNIHK